MVETVRRDDGSRLAVVSTDGAKGLFTMFAPDGGTTLARAWLLSKGEVRRLKEALGKTDENLVQA